MANAGAELAEGQYFMTPLAGLLASWAAY